MHKYKLTQNDKRQMILIEDSVKAANDCAKSTLAILPPNQLTKQWERFWVTDRHTKRQIYMKLCLTLSLPLSLSMNGMDPFILVVAVCVYVLKIFSVDFG